MSVQEFKDLFRFDPDKAFLTGVERERFITCDGAVVPRAAHVLSALSAVQAAPEEFGYELSACQVESRTTPLKLEALAGELHRIDATLARVLRFLNLGELHSEVGPADMPLDIYPDPTGRYQVITKNMPVEVLRAACRVIGTHVHIGMRNHQMALRVYNYVIRHYGELCELGNGSFGERLAIYRQMAPDFEPKPYESWRHYHAVALEKGFAKDPRQCWTLVRISVHGTIEFRMFGATDSVDRIVGWASRCHALCQEALVHA